MVVTPRASAIVALDGDDVVLTRQARYAIDRSVVEIVKGGAADGEGARAAAERELREEIGVVAARWDELGIVYEIPSIVQEPVTLFLARDLQPVRDRTSRTSRSIVTLRMPFRAALLAAARGEIEDAVTGVALIRAAQCLDDERNASR